MRRFLFAAALAAVLPSAAIAQERQFAVTLPESQWNELAKILAEVPQPWSKMNPLISGIGNQIGQSLQREGQQRQQDGEALKKASAEVDRLTAEVARLAEELKKYQPEEPPK